MKNFNFFVFTRNFMAVYFLGWLIVSPVPTKNSTNSTQQPIEIVYKISGGRGEKYDFTRSISKAQPFKFWSREGLLLSADHRSLRKIVYSHSEELGLTDLISRIPCPIQSDPKKFQRLDCWAITNQNIKEALIKVFEFTIFKDSNIITAEMMMHEAKSLATRATYFIDQTTGTGVSMYFHKGGKQYGKLWSMIRFDPESIPTMLNNPSVHIIDNFSQNP